MKQCHGRSSLTAGAPPPGAPRARPRDGAAPDSRPPQPPRGARRRAGPRPRPPPPPPPPCEAPSASASTSTTSSGASPAAARTSPSGPLLENLTRCVIEILAGARELDQIARWVSDDVYRHLLKRVVLSARARRTKGQSVTRPVFSIGTVTSFSPRDGVIEAVIVVHGRARARAVAIRLEGLDRRWRATAINVL
ncbi:Rv3235 family protein [Clavibacter zhangzhiyongii]|uniref:Rv3235 family protein n=1 Tax=Clavibacter zhangzhiyongii TaxID=2768071 RepID=UPI0039E03B71